MRLKWRVREGLEARRVCQLQERLVDQRRRAERRVAVVALDRGRETTQFLVSCAEQLVEWRVIRRGHDSSFPVSTQCVSRWVESTRRRPAVRRRFRGPRASALAGHVSTLSRRDYGFLVARLSQRDRDTLTRCFVRPLRNSWLDDGFFGRVAQCVVTGPTATTPLSFDSAGLWVLMEGPRCHRHLIGSAARLRRLRWLSPDAEAGESLARRRRDHPARAGQVWEVQASEDRAYIPGSIVAFSTAMHVMVVDDDRVYAGD